MNYDNIKSHKKPGFHRPIRGYIFQGWGGGGCQIDPPGTLGLRRRRLTLKCY